MQPGTQTLHASGGPSAFWGLLGVKLHYVTRNAQVSGTAAQVYRRYREACFILCDEETYDDAVLTFTNPYDVVPGGYQPTWALLSAYESEWHSGENIFGFFLFIWSSLSASAELDVDALRHVFVPTVSALDYRTTSYSSRSALVNATFLNQNLSASINRSDASRTPFDAFYVSGDKGDAASIRSENQPHLFVSNGIEAFILEQLTLPVPDRIPPTPVAFASGSSCIRNGYAGSFSASASGGTPPYTYTWEMKPPCFGGPASLAGTGGAEAAFGGDPGDPPTPQGPSCSGFNYIGTGPQITYAPSSNNVPYGTLQIRVTAEDAQHMEDTSNTLYVSFVPDNGPDSCGGGDPPGVNGEGATQAMAGTQAGVAPLPERYALHAVVPNPVSRLGRVLYDLPEASEVSLVVYDLLGREVARLVSGSQAPGAYQAILDTADLPRGAYLVHLRAGSFAATQQVTVLN